MDIILGTFNSEKYWRPNDIAELPQINHVAFDHVVSAIDEIQCILCSSSDLLVTLHPFNECLKDYLNSIGICFTSFHPLCKEDFPSSVEHAVISSQESIEGLSALINEPCPSINNISPYSILSDTGELFRKLNITGNVPEISSIIRVNSKVFSTEISNQLGLLSDSRIISSSLQLRDTSIQLLQKGSVLIKDPFGVSGKGSLLVDSPAKLDRICSYLKKQEDKGRYVQCIVEPVYKKVLDFSSIYNLTSDGKAEFISVQKMSNQNNSYMGTTFLDDNELTILDRNHYYDNAEKVLNQVYDNGYFGPVCIDSMVIENQEVIPLIEINARKSMSNIHYSLNKILKPLNLCANLMNYSLVIPPMFNYERFINTLREEHLLFTSYHPEGIIPLSANSLIVNQNHENFYGKFYFGTVANDPKVPVLQRLKQVLEKEHVKIM